LKYGTVPIVRGVGGLEDTIIDYTKSPDTGTGFKFHEYTKDAMLNAIKRAISVYQNQSTWQSLVKRCMGEDFSWEKSAKEYVELYKKAIAKHEPH
jgi:starch synthase